MEVELDEIKTGNNIIDIRKKLDFETNHLPGSINVPRLKLMSNPGNYMDKSNNYYLICDTGSVGLSCVKLLNALGYKCYNIKGGVKNIKKF